MWIWKKFFHLSYLDVLLELTTVTVVLPASMALISTEKLGDSGETRTLEGINCTTELELNVTLIMLVRLETWYVKLAFSSISSNRSWSLMLMEAFWAEIQYLEYVSIYVEIQRLKCSFIDYRIGSNFSNKMVIAAMLYSNTTQSVRNTKTKLY